MPALLALVIALPPALLLLGVALGVAGARWWWLRRAAALQAAQAAGSSDEEAASVALGAATAVPSAVALPPGRKASTHKLSRSIHIVASSASLQPARSGSLHSSEACLPLGLRLGSAGTPPVALPPPAAAPPACGMGMRSAAHRPAALQTPDSPGAADGAAPAPFDTLTAEEQLRSLVGGSMGGSGSLSPGGPLGHRKTASMDLGQLVRAGPSVISQVMEDWEARSTLYRIMSGMEPFAAPGSPVAAGGLLSPAAALFSPGGGAGASGAAPSMPPGEVHMDEIDLIECIGKGGYGCVYKASWRGAGVAVKYIKCPTDDADSLGRAIREVVLSKKMSHPNVVQCYSWTVLTEPDNGRCATPTGGSDRTSPLQQSFTSSRRQRRSLDLLRPRSAPQQASVDLAHPPSSVRRGLDLRFNAAAGADSPSGLHRITERPTLEGRALQLEVEAAVGPPTVRPAATTELIAELVAEAAQEPRQVQQHAAEQPSSSTGAGSSREASPEVEAQVVGGGGGGGKPGLLKLMGPVPSSQSPGSSPGIQAVHGSVRDLEALVAEAEQAAAADGAASPHREAVSVEPACESLPASPFASRAGPALRRTSSGTGAGAAQPLPLAVRPQQLTTEEDEGEDVYARFSSYEEMVAHFQQLAADSPPDSGQEDGQLQAAVAAALSRGSSLQRNSGSLAPRGGELGPDFTVTAASSFSDVLSVSGFMLEGSCNELAVLSQPSSPRQHLQQRAGQPSWFLPSAATSRPGTPPSLAALQQPPQLQPSRFSRAVPAQCHPGMLPSAGLPCPAWQAESAQGQVASMAGTADGASQGERLQDQAQQHGSLDAPAAQPSSEGIAPALPCSSTVSFCGWQPAEPPAPDAAAAIARQEVLQASGQQQQQQQQQALLADGGSDTLPAAEAWGPEYHAAAAAAARGCGHAQPPPPQQQQHYHPHPHQLRAAAGGCRSSGNSGTVTPRVGSLSNLGPAGGAEGSHSQQVTPRAPSIRGPGGLQVSPRADSVRSAPRSPSNGLQRVEELRGEALGGSTAASVDRLSLGSHNDSFNSEEGFGSPVKQRCGGVKDVFLLEELQLAGQEALMVVVMEYCDLGSLRKALQRRAFRPSAKWPFQTTYRALLRTAQEIAKGMGYIHEFNIVHGDLKPGNVLLKTHKVDRRGYIAKVSDFGLSQPLDAGGTHASLGAALGTIAYSAPETFLENRLRKPSDVYAFGVMLWEMFYCEEPYENLLEGQICVGVSDGTLRPEFRDDCPKPYRRLAERCWHQDPEQRPSFEEIDAELVRIEMEFRLHRHRANSKRASSAQSAGTGGGSLPASRPGSPDVAPGGGRGAPAEA